MYLIGASGHGKVVAELAEENKIPIEGFIDRDSSIKTVLDYKIVANNIDDLEGEVVVCIGDNFTRKNVVLKSKNVIFKKIYSSRSNISKRAIVQEGTVVMMGATINSDVQIGKHCIINTNASIDHDSIIEDYVHISPNVGLAGNVEVGEGTHIGIGACVIQGIKIGKWCTIGAGSVIIKDIPDYAVVVGNPGKIIKYNDK